MRIPEVNPFNQNDRLYNGVYSRNKPGLYENPGHSTCTVEIVTNPNYISEINISQVNSLKT